jgi:predicted MFS family arabinose efflux permease
VILTRYFRRGSEGAAIGWNGFSYNLGYVAGLAGWAVLGSLIGWRLSLLLSGLICAILGILVLVSLPKLEAGLMHLKLSLTDLKMVFSDRRLSLLTIALFGIGASSNITSNFLVYYLETAVHLSASFSGAIGGIGQIFSFAAPIIGRNYDRSGRLRSWMLCAALIVSAGVGVTAIGSAAAGLLSSSLVAIGASTGYTVGLTKARDIGRSIRSEYESVAVAWTDSISLLGGFVSPIIFSAIVTAYGYPAAWIGGALFALVLFFPLYLSKSASK